MSKYGDNNGSNGQPQPKAEASLNGFRLDSTQSSWLMDRLEALSEEEKISVAAEADRLAVQHHPALRDPQKFNPAFRGEVMGQVHGQNLGQGGQMRASVGEGGQVGNPEYSGRADRVRQSEYHAAGNDHDDRSDSDVSARHLKEKIESLEQQLAEISNLTTRQAEEEFHPEGRESEAGQDFQNYGQDGQVLGHDPSGQYGSDYGAEGGYQDPRHQAGYPAGHYQDPGAHSEQPTEYFEEPYGQPQDWSQQGDEQKGTEGAVYRGVEYEPDKMDKEKAREVIAKYQAYLEEDEDGQSANPYNAGQEQLAGQPLAHYPVQYEGSGAEHAELPQFLTPMPKAKSSRPGVVSMIGGVIAAAILGGLAYSYLGEGVTDIVKTEFGGVAGKQGGKLSSQEPLDKADKTLEKEAVPVEKSVMAVSPADIASDFGVSKLVGTAGEDVPLIVRLPRGNYPSAFMVVKNLPEWAQLNKGRLVNGAWILGFSDLSDLKVAIPEDQPGQFTFDMEFVHSADEDPIKRTVNAEIDPVVVKPVEPEKKAEVANLEAEGENSEMIKPPEAGALPRSLIIDQALEEKWLERGTRLLRAGDVAAARLAFSHLAEQGSGRGAMAMAMTFDPNQPSARVVAGIKPDVKRAKFWYKRALSLGNEGARDPLRMLETK